MTVTYDLTPLNGTLDDEITLTYDSSSETGHRIAMWWINYDGKTDGNKTYRNSIGDDKRLAAATTATMNTTIKITQELLDKDIKTISLFFINGQTSSNTVIVPLSEATLLKTWNVHYGINLYYKLRTLGNQWFYTKPEIDTGTITPTNKNFITTSFVPSKLKTTIYKGVMENKNDISLQLSTSSQGGYVQFKFECNTDEYYKFNIVVQSTASIDVYNITMVEGVDTLNLCATLNTGTHTIKIGKNQLIIDNTSITNADTYASLRFVNNSANTAAEFYFSNKQWYHEATFFDKIYPIGSVHITTNSINPSNYFDGEWERIEDTFLLASGATYENGSTGGSATVTLTAAQSGVPQHTHTYAHTDTTYKANTTSRKPGTATAANYVTSITATANNTTKTSNNNTAQNASEAHNNMPPYLAVYMWERVG